jgi:biotin carboxyl carrier protein
MSKTYNITVNGQMYSVVVDEVGGTAYAPAPAAASAPIAAAPAAAPAPTAEVAPAVAPSAGTTVVEAPMPGTILDILVNAGDSVTEGAPLLILEAMKMENEIVAPQSGTVDAVLTSKGAAVNAGDALVSLK